MTAPNYATASISLIAAAQAGVALASLYALRIFDRALDDVAKLGGGIGDVSLGIWQATRVPLWAAWIAMIASLVALLFAFRAAKTRNGDAVRSSGLPWLAGLALASGVASVLLFRGMTAFVLDVILPAQARWMATVTPPAAIASRLSTTAAWSALCLIVAVAAAVIAFTRRRGALRVAVIALVVSFAVSAAMVVELRGYGDRFRRIATMGAAHERR